MKPNRRNTNAAWLCAIWLYGCHWRRRMSSEKENSSPILLNSPIYNINTFSGWKFIFPSGPRSPKALPPFIPRLINLRHHLQQNSSAKFNRFSPTLCIISCGWASGVLTMPHTTKFRGRYNDNGKECKYVCVTTNKPDTKSNPNSNPTILISTQ